MLAAARHRVAAPACRCTWCSPCAPTSSATAPCFDGPARGDEPRPLPGAAPRPRAAPRGHHRPGWGGGGSSRGWSIGCSTTWGMRAWSRPPLMQHVMMRPWTAAVGVRGPSTTAARVSADRGRLRGRRGLERSACRATPTRRSPSLTLRSDETSRGCSASSRSVAWTNATSGGRPGTARWRRRPAPRRPSVSAVVEVFRRPDCSFLTPPAGVALSEDRCSTSATRA